jgi:hypothetical protein
MTALKPVDDPLVFWLIQTFLRTQEDESEELPPLSNTYVIITGTAILIIIVIARFLVFH